ncbi:hypothetical protein AVEN_44768-1 [Araneus ventricosus]|uniref:Uncharacterized protein n=1 Tax=Araneus ventricosus TaxID=182803 RepID=A0A4Y2LNR9_ARAVE|nr:hypothetical protein AVEN_44768-1 [Araneus ventricosus]
MGFGAGRFQARNTISLKICRDVGLVHPKSKSWTQRPIADAEDGRGGHSAGVVLAICQRFIAVDSSKIAFVILKSEA